MTTYQGHETSLVSLLQKEGLITLEQGERVEELAYESGLHVGEVLVREGFITEKEIARFLTIQFQKPFVRISHYDLDDEVLQVLPPALYFEHKFLPIDQFEDILLVASAGILTDAVIEEIYTTTRCDVEVYISLFSEIELKFNEVFSDDVIDESLAAKKLKQRETGRVTRDVELPPEVANFFDSVATSAFSTQSAENPMLEEAEVSGVLPPDVLNFFDTCESAALQGADLDKLQAKAKAKGKAATGKPRSKDPGANTSELPPDVLNFFDTVESKGVDVGAGSESEMDIPTGPIPEDVAQFFDTNSGQAPAPQRPRKAAPKAANTGPMPEDVAQFFDTSSGAQDPGEVSAELPDDVKDFFDTASGAAAAGVGKMGTASMPADVISFFESTESDSHETDASGDEVSAELPADVLNFFDTNTQAQPSKKKSKASGKKSSKGSKRTGKDGKKKKKKPRRSDKLGNTQQALKFFESTESEAANPTISNLKKGKKRLVDEGAELFIDAASTSELPADVLDFFDAVDSENES